MRKTFFFVSMLCVLISIPTLGVGGNMGGSDPNGSYEKPYLIEDVNDFDEFASDPVYWAPNTHTKLTANIDLSGKTYTTAVIAPDTLFLGAFDGIAFEGVFDGNNLTITNLRIDTLGVDNAYLGLFGYIQGSDAKIQNVGIEDMTVIGGTTGSLAIGGLVGFNDGGQVSNCYAVGSVSGFQDIGGLIGRNAGSGIVVDSYCSGSVSGNCGIGGLTGANTGSITGCYSNSNVTGADSDSGTGGLVGFNEGSISNCYSTGEINGGRSVGGLCGTNIKFDGSVGVINNCYSTGSASGTLEEVGGLVGMNIFGSITNCYSIGLVSGSYDSVGGFIGLNDGIVSYCYSISEVSGVHGYVDGFVGQNGVSSSITSSFWDVETSGIGTPGENNYGAIGKTTSDMQTLSTFDNADWDFAGETDNGTENIWWLPIEDYPTLTSMGCPFNVAGDVNKDCKVNIVDIAMIAESWLLNCFATPQACSE